MKTLTRLGPPLLVAVATYACTFDDGPAPGPGGGPIFGAYGFGGAAGGAGGAPSSTFGGDLGVAGSGPGFGGSSSAFGGSGPTASCITAFDCGESTACATYACGADGRCHETFVAAGVVLADALKYDCQAPTCDGHGNVVLQPADDPPEPASGDCVAWTCVGGAPMQTNVPAGTSIGLGETGDCLENACDGKGNVVTRPADDPPTAQGVCAIATCEDGTAKLTPQNAGMSCSTHHKTCDATGACSVASPDGPNCGSIFDCATPANPCDQVDCDDGTCIVSHRAAGSVVADAQGNCLQTVCDGAGNASQVPDDTDSASDGNDCTIDGCSMGAPTHAPRPTGHPCRQSGGHYCTPQTTCVPCPVPDLSCTDYGVGEKNDTEATSYDIGGISDDDDDGATICGVIASGGDVDWYRYEGYDGFLTVVDPTRQVNDVFSGVICAYFACNGGTASFACPDGTASGTSPNGLPGCCLATDAQHTGFSLPDIECEGTVIDDDITVLMSVAGGGPLGCSPYQLAYHY